MIVKCPVCNSTGWIESLQAPCIRCEGTGFVKFERSIKKLIDQKKPQVKSDIDPKYKQLYLKLVEVSEKSRGKPVKIVLYQNKIWLDSGAKGDIVLLTNLIQLSK